MRRAHIKVLREGHPPRRVSAGFTLLEVLVAISVLAVITAIVYASLSSVVTATEIARVSADEMRMRQFLTRSFQTNFPTAYTDALCEDERYVLIGISEDGPRGAMDTIEFASSAPVIGGSSPPGAVKRVFYGAVPNEPGADGNLFDEEEAPQIGSMRLESSEMAMIEPAFAEEYGADLFGDGGGSQAGFGERSFSNGRGARDSGRFGRTGRTGESSRMPFFTNSDSETSPGWSVPVDYFDVSYFDGYEWVEDWDSIEYQGLPWAVRIRINYARTDEEHDADRRAGIRDDEDFDYENIITLPLGAGLIPEEEKLSGNMPNRQGSRGNLFGQSARDENRRNRGDKDDRTNRRNSGSSSFGSRSGTRGGSLFGR